MRISKRVGIVLTIAATMAAVAGSIIAYLTLVDRGVERIEDRYKEHVDEIGRFHNDENLSARTLIKNLDDVINQKSKQDINENKKLRNDIASALIAEFQSGDFDFKQPRNLELDRVALPNWQEYKALLVKNPYSNINILLNYTNALSRLYEEDPRFVERAVPLDNGGMTFEVIPKDRRNESLLRDLHYTFRAHIELLKESLGNNNNQINRNNLLQAFCWYSETTNNPGLTRDAFGYTSAQFEAEKRSCSRQR